TNVGDRIGRPSNRLTVAARLFASHHDFPCTERFEVCPSLIQVASRQRARHEPLPTALREAADRRKAVPNNGLAIPRNVCGHRHNANAGAARRSSGARRHRWPQPRRRALPLWPAARAVAAEEMQALVIVASPDLVTHSLTPTTWPS